MIIIRTFLITHGHDTDTVHFVGPEYDEKSVYKFLVENDKMDKAIVVKQIREVKK